MHLNAIPIITQACMYIATRTKHALLLTQQNKHIMNYTAQVQFGNSHLYGFIVLISTSQCCLQLLHCQFCVC